VVLVALSANQVATVQLTAHLTVQAPVPEAVLGAAVVWMTIGAVTLVGQAAAVAVVYSPAQVVQAPFTTVTAALVVTQALMAKGLVTIIVLAAVAAGAHQEALTLAVALALVVQPLVALAIL
jgi:hypothetical protein